MRTPLRATRTLALGLAALSTTGCPAPEPPLHFSVPPAEAGQLARLRGHLAFIRCGGPPDTLWIADTPDHQVDRALAAFGDGPLPALVRLEGGVVTAVRHVAPEGAGCDRLPPAGDLHASGTEPFWSMTISGDSAHVATPEMAGGLVFGGGRWSRAEQGGAWHFQATRVADGDTLRLEATEARCNNGMSGAWFPYRVEAEWGDRRVTGCGLEGGEAIGPTS